jgi:DNA (cytosine-5)-methyltransferase 1
VGVTIRVLDLFCGGGGSSWGAKTAGAEVVCGVDAWDRAIEAYGLNFGPDKARLLTLTPDTGAEALGDLGPIDMILASPECTHHTCARGSRPRDEESKRTAYYVTRFARDLNPRPRWLVIENVVHMRGWDGYDLLFEELHELGYRTREVVLDASEFGVPQSRRRVFILCDLLEDPPEVTSRARRVRSAASILAKPGRYTSRPLFSDRRAPATLERARRAMDDLPRHEPFLIVYYGSDGAGGWQPLDRPLRTITTLDRFGLVTWERGHPMLRMLQVDELSKAMGFDRGFTLEGIGQRRDRIKLLGNGVCPPVMRAIVESLTATARASGFDRRQETLALAAE